MIRPFPLRLFAAIACSIVLGACGERPESPTDPLEGDGATDRLLSDSELTTPIDPDAPSENAAWSAWVEANHLPIRSLTHDDFSDLGFLRPLVEGKRVVQLGESGHGVREFSQAKVRIIKYLHEVLGFDVVALESSLFECFMADDLVGVVGPIDVLDSCAFPVWRTAEVRELFEYIEDTRRTARPLRLAGFDTQISSRGMSQLRPGFLGELVSSVDPEYGSLVEEFDTEFLANYQRALAGQNIYVRGNKVRLMAAYDSLATFLDDNRDAFAAQGPNADRTSTVAAQTARSMVSFVAQLSAEGAAALETRDEGMAANLDFVLDELFPESRVVVWAHNFHVRYANDAVEPSPQPRTMGAHVDARLGDGVYSIGLYMYAGSAATNDGLPYDVAPAITGSVASIMYRARRRWVFVDLTNANTSPGHEWVDSPVVAKTWGVNPLVMVPREQYDGLIFVHTVTTPEYIFGPAYIPG